MAYYTIFKVGIRFFYMKPVIFDKLKVSLCYRKSAIRSNEKKGRTTSYKLVAEWGL